MNTQVGIVHPDGADLRILSQERGTITGSAAGLLTVRRSWCRRTGDAPIASMPTSSIPRPASSD